MLYTNSSLKNKYPHYSNINQKVSLETKKGNLVRVKNGIYTDNLPIDAPIIANICYGFSYLSFEYALSYYGLIPEHVSMFTSACFHKKNNKTFHTEDAIFEYRSVPDEVFPYGISYEKNENNIRYRIASKEKALCDMLYESYPVRTVRDLKTLLFENLRIDENEFYHLDFQFLIDIAPRYHSNTLTTLAKYLTKINKNDMSH